MIPILPFICGRFCFKVEIKKKAALTENKCLVKKENRLWPFEFGSDGWCVGQVCAGHE